jgi:hypothetical protein
METFGASSAAQQGESLGCQPLPGNRRLYRDRVIYAIYSLALAVSVSTWFIAVRAPLWLDETGSYWQISGGFSKILSRQLISFPAYSYILWFSTKIIGSSEIALRVPSILAMLGAVYLLYLAARELFDREISLIAAIIFCLHPIVIFASIDVRPYAFAVLTTNAAILILLRLRRNDSNGLAALFGLLAAWIVWFHFLFATILPALVLCFFIVKIGNRKALWRQFRVAFAVFLLAFLPVIPGLQSLFHTAGIHVFEADPRPLDIVLTLVPTLSFLFVAVCIYILVAATSTQRRKAASRNVIMQIQICLSLALIPLLILYGLSARTSIHTFVPRHRLDAVPGIALCWAMIFSVIRPRVSRLIACVVLVAISAFFSYSSPFSRQHFYTWKYALEVAEKNASADGAPVLICSDFPEADNATMPLDSAKKSPFFSPLSYYRLSVPVVPMPRALNDEAMRVGSRFLQEAATKHERFLAVAYKPSYATLDWLSQSATATHSVRKLGVFDDIEVLEFVPRTEAVASR